MTRSLLMLAALLLPAATGCGNPDADPDDVTVTWHVEPERPDTGIVRIAVVLADSTGAPIDNANVMIEGIMTHPGMAPSTTAADEVRAGRYEAPLHLTMRGDWILILEARLRDGRTVQRRRDLFGVGTN